MIRLCAIHIIRDAHINRKFRCPEICIDYCKTDEGETSKNVVLMNDVSD